MGIYKFMKWANPHIYFVIFFLTISASAICPRGKQFLDEQLQRCVDCTVCNMETRPVVLRPCEVNKDTECGTSEELYRILDMFNIKPANPVRHKNKKHLRPHSGDILWRFNENPDGFLNDLTTTTYEDEEVEDEEFRRSTEAPFTKAETIVWDWQDITMTLAVFSCILFFLVIALYSFHQARQWRKLKENFDADVEELSASLSLMAVASSEKGEILEPTFGPLSDKNCINNRCVYLEQLLHVRKDTKIGADTGNVYVEDSNPASTGKT